MCSSVVTKVFGGTDDSAQKAQKRANTQAQRVIEEQSAIARQDVLGLFPGVEEAQLLGSQGALDILGQAVPQQIGAFQAGNVGAQQALLAGLPQIQAAILGTPVDLSGLQAQRLPVDLGFAQQQLPEFSRAVPALQAGNTNAFTQAALAGDPTALQALRESPEFRQQFNPLTGGVA